MAWIVARWVRRSCLSLASAHVEWAHRGFRTGWPIRHGLDHIAAMLAVGFGSQRVPPVWVVPPARAVLTLGGLRHGRLSIPFVEPGIIASVLGWRAHRGASSFAAGGREPARRLLRFHGHVHGRGVCRIRLRAGVCSRFVVATASLHCRGMRWPGGPAVCQPRAISMQAAPLQRSGSICAVTDGYSSLPAEN